MAAEKEALCKTQEEVMRKLTLETDTLKKSMRRQKTEVNDGKTLTMWEERCINQQKRVAEEDGQRPN